MDSDLRPGQSPSVNSPNPAIIFAQPLSFDTPLGKVTGAQQLLFARTPRNICDEAGLNWWSAAKLYEEGWLSFSPEATPRLDESQEAELRFLAALVVAGCDRGMLAALLGGLSRPYAYDLRHLYYDWTARAWRMLPDLHIHPESDFSNWIEYLVRTGDIETLKGIMELAGDALARVRSRWPEPELYRSK